MDLYIAMVSKAMIEDLTMWIYLVSGNVTFALLRGVGLRHGRAVGVGLDGQILLLLQLHGVEITMDAVNGVREGSYIPIFKEERLFAYCAPSSTSGA